MIPVVARNQDYFTEQNKQYYIYVYEEDEGKAVKALNESR